MNREPNAQLIAVMDEAKVSNKGLAKRMTDEAARRGMDLGTTHIAVKRWRDGSGIKPQTAAIMADVLSAKLGRRITPGDLGFFDHTKATASDPIGYPSTVPDVLSMLDGLAQERADAPASGDLIIADADLSSPSCHG